MIFKAMMFNQLDTAINILKKEQMKISDCYYLLFEALARDKFEFFQAFMKNGMHLKILLENIQDNFNSEITKLYNRCIDSNKVKRILFVSYNFYLCLL